MYLIPDRTVSLTLEKNLHNDKQTLTPSHTHHHSEASSPETGNNWLQPARGMCSLTAPDNIVGHIFHLHHTMYLQSNPG